MYSKYINEQGDMHMEILKSVLYFILAGIFEIGGGYLIWQWFA